MDNLPQEQSEKNNDKSNNTVESEDKKVPEEESKNTQKEKITKRKILIYLSDIIFIGIIFLIVYKVWFIPSYMPSQLYEKSNELFLEIEGTVEDHFYADDLGTTVKVRFMSKDFQKDYVDSYEKYITSTDLEMGLLQKAGFKNFFPIYSYEMTIPLIVELPEYNIEGTATASISTGLQVFTGSGSLSVGTISYSSELYELTEQLNIKASIPVEINNAVCIEDTYGYPIIVVSYTWTNTAEDYASPLYSIMESAYQNGVSLDNVYFLDDEFYDIYSKNKEIAPGQSLDVYVAYYLDDIYSPVTFEITPFTYEENPPKISNIFELDNVNTMAQEYAEVSADSL